MTSLTVTLSRQPLSLDTRRILQQEFDLVQHGAWHLLSDAQKQDLFAICFWHSAQLLDDPENPLRYKRWYCRACAREQVPTAEQFHEPGYCHIIQNAQAFQESDFALILRTLEQVNSLQYEPRTHLNLQFVGKARRLAEEQSPACVIALSEDGQVLSAPPAAENTKKRKPATTMEQDTKRMPADAKCILTSPLFTEEEEEPLCSCKGTHLWSRNYVRYYTSDDALLQWIMDLPSSVSLVPCYDCNRKGDARSIHDKVTVSDATTKSACDLRCWVRYMRCNKIC